MTTFAWRIGQFFILLGLFALVLFFAGLQSDRISLVSCCSGGALVIAGGYAMWRGRNAGPPSERFALIRRLNSRKQFREKGKKR